MSKVFAFLVFLSLSSVVQAGFYENSEFSNEVPSFLRSLSIDTNGCEKSGVVVSFYGSSKLYRFCEGFQEVSKRTYKKCLGREVGGYPFGTRCLGVRKTVVEATKKMAVLHEDKLVHIETVHVDGELMHKEVYTMEIEGDQVLLSTSFVNYDWSGSGEASYLFIKKQD